MVRKNELVKNIELIRLSLMSTDRNIESIRLSLMRTVEYVSLVTKYSREL